MAATFNPALTDPKDRVRQKIGDTVETSAQVQDETILAYLARGLSEIATARQLCLDLAAKWAAAGDVMVDDQRQSGSRISERYMALAARLQKEEAQPTGSDSSAYPGMIVGGLDDTRTAIQNRPQSDYPGWVDF